jgi:hypothetical protein
MTCPECGYTPAKEDDYGKPLDEFEQLDEFEVIGACGLNVFCPRCSCEFNPDTGEPHDPDKCELCKWQVKTQIPEGMLF